MTTVIKNYVVENENFVICKNESGYWSFNEKDIKDNILQKEYNGFSGHLGKSLNETLNRTYIDVKVKKYVDFNKVFEGDEIELDKYNRIYDEANRMFPY